MRSSSSPPCTHSNWAAPARHGPRRAARRRRDAARDEPVGAVARRCARAEPAVARRDRRLRLRHDPGAPAGRDRPRSARNAVAVPPTDVAPILQVPPARPSTRPALRPAQKRTAHPPCSADGQFGYENRSGRPSCAASRRWTDCHGMCAVRPTRSCVRYPRLGAFTPTPGSPFGQLLLSSLRIASAAPRTSLSRGNPLRLTAAS